MAGSHWQEGQWESRGQGQPLGVGTTEKMEPLSAVQRDGRNTHCLPLSHSISQWSNLTGNQLQRSLGNLPQVKGTQLCNTEQSRGRAGRASESKQANVQDTKHKELSPPSWKVECDN